MKQCLWNSIEPTKEKGSVCLEENCEKDCQRENWKRFISLKGDKICFDQASDISSVSANSIQLLITIWYKETSSKFLDQFIYKFSFQMKGTMLFHKIMSFSDSVDLGKACTFKCFSTAVIWQCQILGADQVWKLVQTGYGLLKINGFRSLSNFNILEEPTTAIHVELAAWKWN